MKTLPSSRPLRRRANTIAIIALFAAVAIFWVVVWWQNIRVVPSYSGELRAIREADWITMWTWTDYGAYHRYSPTGLLAFGLIDRYILAPLLGVQFSVADGSQFVRAVRLVPAQILGFVLVAIATYLLCRTLRFSIPSSFMAGLYFGVSKGFAYYFYFASTIAASLLVIYSCGCLIFWTRYCRNQRNLDLLGYYVFFLLAVGAWEQWINLLLFLVAFSAILMSANKRFDKRTLCHGVAIPLMVFCVYLIFRYPSLHVESTSVGEAQYVFSYPAVSLMIEDMIANASLHIASTFDSLLFPWPMLSQSVIGRYDMDTFNPYNKHYTEYSTIHYRAFADWYAGFLFAFFLCATVILLQYLRKHKPDLYGAGMGLCLVYAGFAIHLPIMYRTYFILPGVAGLLDYKHPLSILGASILLGWVAEKALSWNRLRTNSMSKAALVILLCAWIVFANYMKIALSYSFPWGVYPW